MAIEQPPVEGAAPQEGGAEQISQIIGQLGAGLQGLASALEQASPDLAKQAQKVVAEFGILNDMMSGNAAGNAPVGDADPQIAGNRNAVPADF